MRHLNKISLFSGTFLATLGATSLAAADDLYVDLVLDTSGSMAAQDVARPTAEDPSRTIQRWQAGIGEVVNRVRVEDHDNAFNDYENIFYSIHTFSDSDVRRVFPTASNDCGGLTYDADNGGYCRLESQEGSGDDTLFEDVATFLEALPQPDFGPNTPLADAFCERLPAGFNTGGGMSFADVNVRILSDGEESADSISQCFMSPTGTAASRWEADDIIFEDPDFIPDATDPDAGLGTSWQRQVYRRWYTTDVGEGWRSMAVPGSGAGSYSPPAKPTIDFVTVYQTSVPVPMAMGMSSFSFISSAGSSGDAPMSGLFASSFISTMAAPVPPEALGLPSYTSLGVVTANLTGFYQMLSEESGGSFAPVVGNPNIVYGKTHALAGDVDDSGCADQADLSIIMQSDIWGARAEAPLELAIRADLNRDGWVNTADKEILLAPENWGEGCANPPTHPTGGASCHNNVLDGNETDTDCGGDACGPCAAHAVCEEANDCASGVCTGARCVAPVACTESKAIDLGASGTMKTVANNACVKIKNVPSWWGTSRTVLLQTGAGGTYNVPYHWESSCKGTHGSGTLSGNWQSRTFGPTSKNCATLIQLNGSGSGNVKLTYYGQ